MIFSILFPQVVLFFAFTGAGFFGLRLFGLTRIVKNQAERLCLSYFLGQGFLGILFTLMGLLGWLRLPWLLLFIIPSASLCVFYMIKYRRKVLFQSQYAALKEIPRSWQVYIVFLALMIMAGASCIGAALTVDASSFYMAYPKLLAYTGKYQPLPGYDSFSQVGLLAETFIAVLNILGMLGSTARIFSYTNFLPALGLLGALAIKVNTGWRGALLLVGAALTSSCVSFLYGSGKTDLYAVGPALAAFLCIAYTWTNNPPKSLFAIAGFFAGSAAVLKLSYLPSLAVSLVIYAIWPLFSKLRSMITQKETGKKKLILSIMLYFTLAALGVLCGLLPLLLKNQVVFGTWFGITDAGGSFFSLATTIRIVASYPIALVFGRYWAQGGNLSVLYLLAVPFLFFLPRSSLKSSKLLAISIASIAGIIIWIILFPSYIIPRYILFVLLLAGIPLMGGLAAASLRSHYWDMCIPIISVCIIVLTFANGYYRPFATIRFIRSHNEEVENYYTPNAEACSLINNRAEENERIYLLAWPRYWLRPDLIQYLQKADEFSNSPEKFWEEFRAGNFTYVLWDKRSHESVSFVEALLDLPGWATVSELESFEYVSVYHISYSK
jgi:hypothetical protein